MAKSQQSFNKSEKEKKRLKKQKDKLSKKLERRSNSDDPGDMIAYVDENGMITDTPPDPSKRIKVNASSIEIGIPKKEESEAPSQMVGKVSYFDSSKGFGFILDSQTQEKYFVHVSGLLEEVAENDKVTFELQRGLKGMNAVKVKRI